MGNRTKNVIKNSSVSISIQIMRNVVSFIIRTIFIKALGAEYLGVNGLFTDVLTLLSFAELGIGSAINFSLYDPIANNDTEKIKSLMNLYKKCYSIIGLVVAFVGTAICPFIPNIVGDYTFLKENLFFIYFLYLLNTVISYFFVYKKTLIIAYQKNYLVDIYSFIIYVIQVIFQLCILIIWKNFILYLLISILFNFLTNIIIAYKANQLFPYLKDKEYKVLSKTETKSIKENIKALFVYKIGGIVLESVDSIFISSFINISTVGIYSNYKLIVNIFKNICSQAMSSVVASVGNLNTGDDNEKKEKIFNEMFYINSWVVSFFSVGLYIFLTPLINLWIGDKYVIVNNAVFALCGYFYISFMHSPCYTYRSTTKVFLYGRFVPILAACINILLDWILINHFGLVGIIWGSILARFLTYEIVDPLLIYKHIFQANVFHYIWRYIKYFVVMLVSSKICLIIVDSIEMSNWWRLFVSIIIVSVVYNIIYGLLTFASSDSLFVRDRLKRLVHRKE